MNVSAVLDIDPLAREAGERFAAAGHQLFLVGGAVRDQLLGRPVDELDFATDAHPQMTLKVLRGWAERRYLEGVRFGTVGATRDGRTLELTTFREEVYPDDERKPAVTFAKDIETDLSRRDFTINAMAIRLPDGGFIDPFGGLKALADKLIDTPLEPEVSFTDDPLRMLRAARFASALPARVAPRVSEAMKTMRERLRIVSAERIRNELDKLLVGAQPSAGLKLIVDTGLAEEFMPELPALRLEQDPVHRHKDVFAHTLAVVEGCEPDVILRLAALLHDVGKPKTREFTPKGVQFHHHEIVGARMAEERLRALRYPSHTISDVRRLVELHLRFHTYRMGWSDGAVRRYAREAGPLLDRLNQLTRADCTTRDDAKAARFAAMQDEMEERIVALAERENLEALRPPLDGEEVMEHLGAGPGPLIGEALAYLMEVRLERGPIEKEESYRLLDEWARNHSPGQDVTRG